MKKSCPCSCLCNPVWGVSLLRLAVGIMFLIAGFGKVTDIASFQNTLGGMGYEGFLLILVSWFVAIVELLGGLALLLGKFVPCCKLRKLLTLLLLPVIAGIIYHMNLHGVITEGQSLDVMGLLTNLILFAAVWALAGLKPTCPFGIGGCKCVEACDIKKKK